MTNKITKKSDLHREYARVIEMCEGTSVIPYQCIKYNNRLLHGEPALISHPSDYEFSLALVENRPVFVGDKLYNRYGHKVIIKGIREADKNYLTFDQYGHDLITTFSWSPSEQKRKITINGKEFVAPDNDNNDFGIMINDLYFCWENKEDRDEVEKAIIELLEGK